MKVTSRQAICFLACRRNQRILYHGCVTSTLLDYALSASPLSLDLRHFGAQTSLNLAKTITEIRFEPKTVRSGALLAEMRPFWHKYSQVPSLLKYESITPPFA